MWQVTELYTYDLYDFPLKFKRFLLLLIGWCLFLRWCFKTHGSCPASASQVLGLQIWATTPSLYYYFLGDALSLPWCKHSSPYHNFLSSHYTGSRWVLESTILPPKPPWHWYIPPNETAHKYLGLFTKLWHLKGLGKTAQIYMTSTPHVISRWSLIASWQ